MSVVEASVKLTTANVDEAISLANYLNNHGILAMVSETGCGSEVECPLAGGPLEEGVHRVDTVIAVERTWRLHWEHSDSGLFGLPMYTKPSCDKC